MGKIDFFRWAQSAQAAFERAERLPETEFDLQGQALAASFSAASPRKSGRLSKSWKWVRNSATTGLIVAAPYARIVDKGGTQVARTGLGFRIPLPGQASRGNFVTVAKRVRGLTGFIIDRQTRKLVGVRKNTIRTPSHPYMDRARQEWRRHMRDSTRKAMRNAALRG